jgi:hypothetical protein
MLAPMAVRLVWIWFGLTLVACGGASGRPRARGASSECSPVTLTVSAVDPPGCPESSVGNPPQRHHEAFAGDPPQEHLDAFAGDPPQEHLDPFAGDPPQERLDPFARDAQPERVQP